MWTGSNVWAPGREGATASLSSFGCRWTDVARARLPTLGSPPPTAWQGAAAARVLARTTADHPVAARRYPIMASGTHRNRHHSSAPLSQAERRPVFVIYDRSHHPLTPTWPVSGSGDRPVRKPCREHLWTPSGMSILSEQAGLAICSRPTMLSTAPPFALL